MTSFKGTILWWQMTAGALCVAIPVATLEEVTHQHLTPHAENVGLYTAVRAASTPASAVCG